MQNVIQHCRYNVIEILETLHNIQLTLSSRLKLGNEKVTRLEFLYGAWIIMYNFFTSNFIYNSATAPAQSFNNKRATRPEVARGLVIVGLRGSEFQTSVLQ